MAEIVLGIGCSHSPLLNSPAEDYPKHAEIDRSGRPLLDRNGRPSTYGELVVQAGDAVRAQIEPAVLEERATRCTSNVEHLSRLLSEAKLDALIIIGDDQREQFFDDNMPALLVYWGDTIENNLLDLPEDAPDFWKRARSQYHEPEQPRSYPVASKLGAHLISSLMDGGFDVSQSRRLPTKHGEGHAFGFVHRRLMQEEVVPIVPVAINTYFPPNQPRPRRCYQLGRALASAVRAWDSGERIGILASGGLSHFTVDEELDRSILKACRDKDADALCGIPLEKLNSGSSEIRNWITVAGATEHLQVRWQDYVPCYRSSAGTGCGMAFSFWA